MPRTATHLQDDKTICRIVVYIYIYIYRKPNIKRTPIGLRQININEVEEQEIDDEIDTSRIRDGVA